MNMDKNQQKWERAFEDFMSTRRDEREGLTARQQLWAAFEAGARWAASEIARLRARIPMER